MLTRQRAQPRVRGRYRFSFLVFMTETKCAKPVAMDVFDDVEEFVDSKRAASRAKASKPAGLTKRVLSLPAGARKLGHSEPIADLIAKLRAAGSGTRPSQAKMPSTVSARKLSLPPSSGRFGPLSMLPSSRSTSETKASTSTTSLQASSR